MVTRLFMVSRTQEKHLLNIFSKDKKEEDVPLQEFTRMYWLPALVENNRGKE